MTEEDSTLIKIQLARIEERQLAQAEQQEHRHNNLKMALEGMATKREVDVVTEKLASAKADLSKRIEQLESNQSRLVWGLLGSVGAIGIQMLGLTKKLGF